jgi:autophagy-related protein 2
MSSWYSSWLPELPSISFVPASIQRRFISFVLKKSLGHLLKPGQLDVNQIESQIGSGFVQINDLQLDNQVRFMSLLVIPFALTPLKAINSALFGLPIELYEGSISCVTARIPWPNPLTSTVGLSLDSLHLTFHLLPFSTHAPSSTANLAESVASVADSFIHDELSPREEATLRESFHPDLASSMHSVGEHNVPGGLDPFISAPEEEEFRADTDPAGISIFATLIERLLARFEFDAVNTNITLVNPERSSFSICIPEIIYCTEQRPDESEPPLEADSSLGETRMVTISGLSVTARNLLPPVHVSPTPSAVASEASSTLTSAAFPRSTTAPEPKSGSASPASSSSSSSSLDDETHYAMSQSLAFLPPRVASPASSIASSMYQSAISHAPHFSEDEEASGPGTPSPDVQMQRPDIAVPLSSNQEPEEHIPTSEVILSFGSDPVVIRLTTPLPPRPGSRTNSSDAAEVVKLSLDAGVIGAALRAWHVKGVMDLLDMMSRSLQTNQSSSHSTPSSGTAPGLGLIAEIALRGVVIVMLPAARSGLQSHPMTDFFNRPLIPPKLPHSYLRIHLDNISTSLSSVQSGTSPDAVTCTFSLSEVSAFVFHSAQSVTNSDTVVAASPLLITDHYLYTQYPPSHRHPDSSDQHDHVPFPSFEVMDWTDAKHKSLGMKVSHWRTKVRPKHSKSTRRDGHIVAGSPTSDSTPTDAALPPAILVTVNRLASKNRSPSNAVEVVVEPLHVFVDLEAASNDSGLLAFLDELSDEQPMYSERASDDPPSEDSEDVTPPASPHSRSAPGANEQEKERRRLEKMVLRDLDLDLDYRPGISSKDPSRSIYKVHDTRILYLNFDSLIFPAQRLGKKQQTDYNYRDKILHASSSNSMSTTSRTIGPFRSACNRYP